MLRKQWIVGFVMGLAVAAFASVTLDHGASADPPQRTAGGITESAPVYGYQSNQNTNTPYRTNVNPSQPAATIKATVVTIPDGLWTREVASYKVQLACSQNTMHGTIQAPLNGNVFKLDFTAEYSVSQDGLLYGVIHSAELSTEGKLDDTDEVLLLGIYASQFVDRAFSMRVHNAPSGLVIKSVHVGLSLPDSDTAELDQMINAILLGRFTKQTKA